MSVRRPLSRRSRVRFTLTAILLALTAVSAAFIFTAAVHPGVARADSTELSIMMDDQPLLYTSNAAALSALERMKGLGVNVVRVSMVWALVAPDPTSNRTPAFANGMSDPGSYPYGAWARYDYLDEAAHSLGMTLYFDLTGPAPNWAVAHDPNPSYGHPWSYEPNISDFQKFAEAVGTRYSGNYTTTTTSCKSQTISFGGIVIPIGPVTCTQAANPIPIPAVNWWSIWNEPDEVGWLTPQTRTYNGQRVNTSASYYRRMADAAYSGLLATGHIDGTILLGELTSAPNSVTRPLPFMRDLYCVGGNYQPLTGSAATALGCPASGNRATFVTSNPVLFAATGLAYHPYSFIEPNRVIPGKPWATDLANLNNLTSTLSDVLGAYNEPTGMPIYMTEFAYVTKPPDPYGNTTLSEQATWLNQAEYLTYLMPRVKSMAQFLLYDLPPLYQYPKGSVRYWYPFQSGLMYLNGKTKPAYYAYRLPIWIPSQHTGQSVYVWGQVRPAAFDGPQAAELQFKRSDTSTWQYLSTVVTTNSQGFLTTHAALPYRGQVRLKWTDLTSGDTFYSRDVTIN
jgi:hypothetical protein